MKNYCRIKQFLYLIDWWKNNSFFCATEKLLTDNKFTLNCSEIRFKITGSCFEILIIKFIWKSKGLRITKTIFKKSNKFGWLICPNFKINYKAMSIKITYEAKYIYMSIEQKRAQKEKTYMVSCFQHRCNVKKKILFSMNSYLHAKQISIPISYYI